MSTQNKLNEKEWKKLLNIIDNEEVVLILGDELSAIKINGQRRLLKDYILSQLVLALNDGEPDSSKHLKEEDVLSFSDISYDYKKKEWHSIKSDPYMETTDILSNISKSSYDTEALQKLFSLNKFKIVLTTGFDNIACSVLEDLYGKENVEHLSYKRGSNGPDLKPQLDKILFYQLFGKASSDMHSFVLSEDDLLDFIHFWMDQNYRPKVLSNVLRDKYILVLGCNYPNWLFRFFFHSLKYSSTMRQEGHANGLLADINLDPELVSFLRRMETSVYEDAINFINELYDRWEKRAKGNTIDDNTNQAVSDDDDFDGCITLNFSNSTNDCKVLSFDMPGTDEEEKSAMATVLNMYIESEKTDLLEKFSASQVFDSEVLVLKSVSSKELIVQNGEADLVFKRKK